jgi:hypothetical protein
VCGTYAVGSDTPVKRRSTVGHALEKFEKDEVERLPDGKLRNYRNGEFILHLNGIDRERSASYNTPEVLTKYLVEETLRELLKDYTREYADKIQKLKIF